MKPLRYHPAAHVEIDAAHDWYLRQSRDPADGFYEELIRALDRVQAQPALYPDHLYGTRRLVLHRYPFFMVFRERSWDVQIVAIAHAERRPGYWAKRLKQ